MQSLNIILDSPTPFYSSGDLVKGHLNFTVDERLKVKSVNIEFIGNAKLNWTEYSHGFGSGNKLEDYRSNSE